jgi:hypothetical protein
VEQRRYHLQIRETKNSERRKGSRVPIFDEQIVVMGHHSNTVGVLRDIGEGGLKIEYMSDMASSDQWTLIDILANRRDQVLLAAVPSKIVYDIKDMSSYRTFTGVDVRLCGVCFYELTPVQFESLHKLLDGDTIS